MLSYTSQACRRFCSIHSGSPFWRDSSTTASRDSPRNRSLAIDDHPVLFLGRFEPFIALLFEFIGQLFPARFDDAPVEHDMDKVRGDVVQHALVVRDEQDAQVG